ncbi:Transmembrane transcriptional regulator (anti-sigma factor RsiW) [Rhizobiales bacterium GAS191]|nr:Transmembrane transcriptional regulator (anti-sigma factor RsiW) [Rhizobiales bacterium GAS191]
MTDEAPEGRPADADLVAYFDGELTADHRAWIASWVARDEQFQTRLVVFANGGRPFHKAFEPLLAEAPRAKLADMLARLPGYRAGAMAEPSQRRSRAARIWPRLALLAAGLVLFFAGASADRLLPRLRDTAGFDFTTEAGDDWRQAVAEYISLYAADTLADIRDDAASRERELAMVGNKLGVVLPMDQLSLPGLTIKWAQLLQYDGKPLGQIAYLDPRNAVVALCIYADGRPDTAQGDEQRAGLNIVHWSSRGRAFMLVGHMATPQLQGLAGLLSRQLTL